MKKNLLFSMAVAVVVCFSVVTATLLTGCGSSASVKTVNIYNDTPKYEINTLTDHTTAMQGFELAGLATLYHLRKTLTQINLFLTVIVIVLTI